MREIPPLSCDTLVALPSVTADGVALFGKNSDRYPMECQRLVLVPGAAYPEGARVSCQYIDIPQVRRTARVLGSQPEWLWGFEHGVNEYGVAIGNEMIATREPVASIGLLGMDLVRLGLERARRASEAIEVIIALIEAHGQGGSGQPDVDWPYHNSFLACDPDSAWVLEASGRHWAARSVSDLANISNHPSIGTDWDRIGPDVATFAADQGWWADRGARLNFAEAYRDVENFSPKISENRHRRGSELLQEARGRITNATIRAILRDHYESGTLYRPGCSPEDGNYFSLCMHVGSLMGTTASMIVRLSRGEGLPVAWAALGCPCTSAYLPYYLEGELPEAVSRGGKDPSPDSLWWSFRELLARVESNPEELGPPVRAYWDAFEAEVDERALQVEARVADLRARGDLAGAAGMLTDFMDSNVRALAEGLKTLESMAAAVG